MPKSVKHVVGLSLAVLVACGVEGRAPVGAQEKDVNAVTARDAWVRIPAPSKDETALYVVVENHTAERRAIVSVSTDAAAKAEMHQMKMDGRMMTMLPVAQIAIPAKGKTELRSGGLHIMLFGLKARPAVGDAVHVTLTLDDGSTIPVTATVRK